MATKYELRIDLRVPLLQESIHQQDVQLQFHLTRHKMHINVVICEK